MRNRPPHDRVYARLGVSPISGVGVFAIRDIPAGTDLFPNDSRGVRWIDSVEIEAIAEPAIRQLYEDFAVRRGEKLGCPENFNIMTVGWYLNEAPAGERPNVDVENNLRFTAARDIVTGEELTIRYASFSDA